MTTTPELDVHVSTSGAIDPTSKQYAVDKVTVVAAHTGQPILGAEVKLRLERNPSLERPAVAEATLDVNGRPVRAHVAATTVEEAIDLLELRLRRRLERQETVLAEGKHRGTTSAEGSWRHGDQRQAHPGYADRPVEERDVVRHKTFALDPMTLDEAAFDLDMLGHQFYLFTEIGSGVDGLLVHDDEGYTWHPVDPDAVLPAALATPIERSATGAPSLALDEALERLDSGGEPWVLFVDADTGRGEVAYRRFDGHYGLITPATDS